MVGISQTLVYCGVMSSSPQHQVRAPIRLLSKCHSSELNYNALIEPFSNCFESTGLLVAHSVSIHYAKTTLLILNPSLSPITLLTEFQDVIDDGNNIGRMQITSIELIQEMQSLFGNQPVGYLTTIERMSKQ